MKKLVFVIFGLFVAACGGGSGGGSGGSNQQIISAETACFNGSAVCDNTVYNRYGEYGWSAYPAGFKRGHDYTAYFKKNGFCGCPAGTRPASNASLGLGCVDTEVATHLNQSFTWSMGYISYADLNPADSEDSVLGTAEDGVADSRRDREREERDRHQVRLGRTGGGEAEGTPTCYKDLVESCLIAHNSCANGAACEATSAGSPIGLCVK